MCDVMLKDGIRKVMPRQGKEKEIVNFSYGTEPEEKNHQLFFFSFSSKRTKTSGPANWFPFYFEPS